VERVLEFYGARSAQWLSDLTHREMPWKRARGDLGPGQRGANQIKLAWMHEYYSGLASSS